MSCKYETFFLAHFKYIDTTIKQGYLCSFKHITSSPMRGSILSVDSRGCGRDRLPLSLTHNHNRPGEHWVSFYIDELFRQLRLAALRSKILLMTSTKLHHVSLEYDNAIRNTITLQGILSQTCGYCCVLQILCLITIILASFLICLSLIVSEMTD